MKHRLNTFSAVSSWVIWTLSSTMMKIHPSEGEVGMLRLRQLIQILHGFAFCFLFFCFSSELLKLFYLMVKDKLSLL